MLATIAEAGGLPQPSRPLAKDLGQAKQLLEAHPDLTAEQVELTVRHMLRADPGFWNRKQPINPAAVRKFLPIVLADERKSNGRTNGYFNGFEAAGGAA